MAQDIIKAFSSTLLSPLAAISDFSKSPLNYYKTSDENDFLKKSAALYILSGVIMLFSMKKQMEELYQLTGHERAVQNLNLIDVPVIGDLFIVVYGMIFVLAFAPSAYFIALSTEAKRTGAEYSGLIFALGAIGAFILAIPNGIATFAFPAENRVELSDVVIIRSVVSFIPILVYFPIFAINLKRFSPGVSWGRLFIALLISTPFSLALSFVINFILF
jgi:hypothetical protein